ncbi:MAG: hypothetical protein IT166_01185 [Bryobacterales bacterium]|nr:hypothetical protein [Bryobacterales bacterium]
MPRKNGIIAWRAISPAMRAPRPSSVVMLTTRKSKLEAPPARISESAIIE